MNRFGLLFAALCILAVLLIGCGGVGMPADSNKSVDSKEFRFRGTGSVHAVCTTGMVADLVRAVGGDRVQVTQLMGDGVDPHLYKTSVQDLRTLNAADIVFYSGLHLEGKMAEALEHLSNEKPSIAVASAIDKGKLLKVGEAQYDPHVWFDVSLWRDALGAVERGLATFDPSAASAYEQRAAKYRGELEALDQYCRIQIAAIPKPRRVLVTAHDAFRYFARAYDIEVRAIQGVSTETEAGVKEINQLIDFLVSRGIKAVFVESSVSDRNVRALVEGCKFRGHDIRVGGELFSDAMGATGTPEATYPGAVRHNVNTIAAALK